LSEGIPEAKLINAWIALPFDEITLFSPRSFNNIPMAASLILNLDQGLLKWISGLHLVLIENIHHVKFRKSHDISSLVIPSIEPKLTTIKPGST
jgi:hypothetical protein